MFNVSAKQHYQADKLEKLDGRATVMKSFHQPRDASPPPPSRPMSSLKTYAATPLVMTRKAQGSL
jgi:hypothetical protein